MGVPSLYSDSTKFHLQRKRFFLLLDLFGFHFLDSSNRPPPAILNFHRHKQLISMADPTTAPAEALADAASTEDQAQQGGRSRGGGGGARRGGRGGRGGQGPPTREVRVSMALSKLLRHKAVSAGITLDAEGFAELDKVVSCF